MFQEGRQKLLDFKGLVSSDIVNLFNILLVDVSTTTAFHLLAFRAYSLYPTISTLQIIKVY